MTVKMLNVLKANDRFDAVTVSYIETIVLFVKRDIAPADRVLAPFPRARARACTNLLERIYFERCMLSRIRKMLNKTR